jgi:uncharacterized protein (DUF2147 family)
MSPLKATLLLFGLAVAVPAYPVETDIVGLWLTGDGDGWIEIQQDGDEFVGVVRGSPKPDDNDPDRVDDKNPNPALRHRKLLGLTIMRGFRHNGEFRWSGGSIYDPNSGNTYKGNLRLVDRNTLKIRGFIGVSLFGRTDTWTRVQN